jgi:iron(III) transport system substrate-binding protein
MTFQKKGATMSDVPAFPTVSRRLVLQAAALATVAASGCGPRDAKVQTVAEAIAWAKANLPNSTPDIIKAAATEGHLTLTMLNQGGNTEVLKTLIAHFNARYPFIAVEYTAQSALQLTNKFNAELSARRRVTDYTNFPANLRTTAHLEQQGAILPFVISQDAAFPTPAKRKGLWYAWRTEYPATTWRNGTLSKDELTLVRTFAGLGDPRFRNRIGIGNIENTSTVAGVYVLLNKEDPKIWQGLAANKPHVKASGPALIDGLMAGEYDVAVLGGMFGSLQAARSGAPIEFGLSAPFPAVYTPGGISILAPHPNAAKLWQDWVMSAEGQRLWVQTTGSKSVRDDINEKAWAEQQPWFFRDKSRQRDIDWDDLAIKQPELIARFKKDMQGG